MAIQPTNLLGLDIGEKRIGVARVNVIVGIPQPLSVLPNDVTFKDKLAQIITEESAQAIVVGLPRNLDGVETKQTEYVRNFVATSLQDIGLPVIFQDETLSSRAAADRLDKHAIHKGQLDAIAAGIILEDYIQGIV